MSTWPTVSYAQWQETCDTLHAHTQLLGKLATRLAPPEPQLQHAALRLSTRGWETMPLPAPDRSGALVVALDLRVAPSMAAGDDLRAPVLRREIVDGDDRGVAVRRPWPRHGVEAVVMVDGLRCLAWMDADRLARGEQVARPQDAVEEREHAHVLGNLLEHAAAPDEGIDALGAQALEGIAAGVRVQVGRQPLAHAPQRGGGEEFADQRVALPIEFLETGLHVHVRGLR